MTTQECKCHCHDKNGIYTGCDDKMECSDVCVHCQPTTDEWGEIKQIVEILDTSDKILSDAGYRQEYHTRDLFKHLLNKILATHYIKKSDIEHEQRVFLDGFSHPKDCQHCLTQRPIK